MSVDEMKKIINEKVETLNEAQLKEVDMFISKINNLPAGELNLMKHVKDIVSERKEVLKKLAK